jgi:glycerol uptake facilitator protein
MIYGEYFPNPAIVGISAEATSSLTPLQAMLAEAVGTALLAFFVFAVTEPRDHGRPAPVLVAFSIGAALSIIIAVLAPLTQAGLNPARDFGPRLFSYFAGWGQIAIPGPRGGFFTVYVLAPIVGALAGGAVHQGLVRVTRPPAVSSPHEVQDHDGPLRRPR